MIALKNRLFNFCFCAFLLIGTSQFALQAQSNTIKTENNISVTINKDTTDDDFNSIINMLAEYQIDAEFDNIKRNKSNEITGITISLTSKTGNQSSSSMSSNTPISEITFGGKNGNIFIGDADNTNGIMQLFGGNRSGVFQFQNDSIFSNQLGNLKRFNFQDFFGSDSLDIAKLRQKLQSGFGTNNNFSYLFTDQDDETLNNQKYRFVDDPNTEKLIVIDGEISDFETLNTLAKADKLEDVEVLKSKTAISVYGKKAKDGAIIAVTK